MVVFIGKYDGGFVLTTELRASSSVDLTVWHDCADTEELFDGLGNYAEADGGARLAGNWDAICFVLVGLAFLAWVKVSHCFTYL